MAGDDSQKVSQNEIEDLLRQAQAAKPPLSAGTGPATTAAPQAPRPAAPAAAGNTIAQADIELLLSQAERALASVGEPATPTLPAGIDPFRLEDFAGAPPSTEAATIELIRDVELDLKIELGRTHMYLEDVLKLRRGSVVPLDKLAGDPVDVYVNGRLIARGEVLVLNDNFCVRVAELVTSEAAAAG